MIKFNEQIASKYRAGLSLKYLENYLENDVVSKSIQQFYDINNFKITARNDFENTLKSNSNKEINWFFKTIIDSRKIIDYKFTDVAKTQDSVTFTIRNKTNVVVPIPIYGVKKTK